MLYSQTLTTLAQWLAGEFENQVQAQDQPAWFVHLRLWHRPIPHSVEGSLALFAEQANVLYLNQPYRQRILLLKETQDWSTLQAQYFAFKSPSQFSGAGADPEKLRSLSMDDLEYLPGCALTIAHQSDRFTAQPAPDATCYFQYEGKTRQVVLGFEVSQNRFLSYDRGVDPETGQGLWGALIGAYDFSKRHDFAAELPATG
ncbi:chromophore lyase CpcT/CpeT [Oculatella sp. LEGE 06141]|uniref:chromophore lyase CpcT/CpeT n=1 Tax=Oculatella sp. LEGE 06141 TaxID=1828648 RepID=UPI00187F28AC|nr:chromophore lyase CpcT/CpeT [Oculatella sp. LEGE 06141]MBE9180562.1 chromophore lyase CpcT/CpeT [Oculatella sp. LEGE 06141]